MKLDLTTLFTKQAELDATIASNHNVTYASTRSRRIMALLVEVGELANATRCFKFWSNKGSEELDRVLDEYADGLHFLLSLGIDLNVSNKTFNYSKKDKNLTEAFLEVYDRINGFAKKQSENSYRKAFRAYLEIIPLLGVKGKDVVKAYYKKLGVNYVRQETNY